MLGECCTTLYAVVRPWPIGIIYPPPAGVASCGHGAVFFFLLTENCYHSVWKYRQPLDMSIEILRILLDSGIYDGLFSGSSL